MPIPSAALAALQRFMASDSPAAAASTADVEPEDGEPQTGRAPSWLCISHLQLQLAGYGHSGSRHGQPANEWVDAGSHLQGKLCRVPCLVASATT